MDAELWQVCGRGIRCVFRNRYYHVLPRPVHFLLHRHLQQDEEGHSSAPQYWQAILDRYEELRDAPCQWIRRRRSNQWQIQAKWIWCVQWPGQWGSGDTIQESLKRHMRNTQSFSISLDIIRLSRNSPARLDPREITTTVIRCVVLPGVACACSCARWWSGGPWNCVVGSELVGNLDGQCGSCFLACTFYKFIGP